MTKESLRNWEIEFMSKPCNCKTCDHKLSYDCGEKCQCCANTGMCPCQSTKGDKSN